MMFRVAPANRPTRVLAACILLGIGLGIAETKPMPPGLVGVALTAVACAVLFFEAWTYGRERWNRRDPYDLSLLNHVETYQGPSRDDPCAGPELPEWEAQDSDTVYCHRCDVSMPTAYSVCPKCGGVLGR